MVELVMHELSICEGIQQVLEQQAQTQGFSRVRKVWLEIGPLAGVELEALRFSFEVVARGTLSEGARLEIVQPPTEAWCLQCSTSVPISTRFESCPECGGHQLQVTSGDQMRIKELEVE